MVKREETKKVNTKYPMGKKMKKGNTLDCLACKGKLPRCKGCDGKGYIEI